jgi:hypothetical protein
MAMCSLCKRNLLAGERFRIFRGERSQDHPVCLLCEDDALGRRWLRSEGPLESVRVMGLGQSVRKVA